MPDRDDARHRHLVVHGRGTRYPFTIVANGRDRAIQARDRAVHGDHLLGQLESIGPEMRSAVLSQERAGLTEDRGIRIEFESYPGFPNAFEKLTYGTTGIELLNVRRSGERSYATVFVPDGKLSYFIKQMQKYVANATSDGKPVKDQHELIDTIQNIKLASIRALWTDADEAFPRDSEEPFWWEAWLSVRGDRKRAVREFRDMAAFYRMSTSSATYDFPERTIVLVRSNLSTMLGALPILTTVAELRRAKDTAAFFADLKPYEERPWVDDLASRVTHADTVDSVPRVCVLDTGVTRGHPLLEGAIEATDMSTIRPDWGTADSDGHGTGIAGLALYGDLTYPLASTSPLVLEHRLESSKLLAEDGGNAGDQHLHAKLTMQAVYSPLIDNPGRRRVYELAISADDYRDKGRPSAWSAAIDRMASAATLEGEDPLEPSLFVIAAGNNRDSATWIRYPTCVDGELIHDPGQSWNALTVGAYTDKVDIAGDKTRGYTPIARAGDLSPFTSTSSEWDEPCPIKPDVVMEGGNAGLDAYSAVTVDSLSLLTTNNEPSVRLLKAFNATSAASALAARMAARIMAAYPALRPETVRGIIVHSARWTDAMLERYGMNGHSNKGEYLDLVRRCGFGVPDEDSALWSLSNSVTMLIEDSIAPFKKVGSTITTKEAVYYDLPWPVEVLEDLGSTDVELRVTLSYFIEPNPSSRGRTRYRYESHGLRFDIKRPTESDTAFKQGRNKYFRNNAAIQSRPGLTGWLIGEDNRHKGSIHCDIWSGTAADLARCGSIVVYPTSGWWKSRTGLNKHDSVARYSLIASISAPSVDVDLYTPIETAIRTEIELDTGL